MRTGKFGLQIDFFPLYLSLFLINGGLKPSGIYYYVVAFHSESTAALCVGGKLVCGQAGGALRLFFFPASVFSITCEHAHQAIYALTTVAPCI